MADLTIALLETLHLKNFEVSVFSGGEAGRNRAVAEWIESEMKTRGHLFKIKYIGSKADLEVTGREGSFADRYKKNLLALGKDIDLKETLLVEDILSFHAKGQKKNTLWLQETFNDLLDYKESLDRNSKYDAPNHKKWVVERNKLAWCLGVISKAEMVMAQKNITFVDAVNLVITDNGRLADRNSKGQVRLLIQGLEKLEKTQTHKVARNSCAFVENVMLFAN